MPSFVSPGVYVVERDFSLYVPNLSTTICGMVGTAQKGPVNEATQITSALQFIQTFGEPDPSMYGPYAALQFLQEGEQLYYVRVAGPDAYQALYQIHSDETGSDTAATMSSGSQPFDTTDALTLHANVRLATDAPLAAGSYIGTPTFTFTETGFGALTVDNVLAVNGDRILVKDQADAKQNGIYVVTDAGSGGSSFILTRATDMDASAEIRNDAFVFVTAGDTLADTGWDLAGFLLTDVLDTNDIVWSSYTFADLVITELNTSTGSLVTANRTVSLMVPSAGVSASLTAANIVSYITGTGGYAGWNFTASESPAGVVKLTAKAPSASSQFGLRVNADGVSILGFDDDDHYGADALSLPAVMIGSQDQPFTIDGTHDQLTFTEVDFRSGAPAIETVRGPFTLNHADNSADDVVEDLNALFIGASARLLATASGNSVVVQTTIENDLFGFTVSGNAANTLGLDISLTHYGALAKWLVKAASPGSWGNTLSVLLEAGSLTGFKLKVYEAGVLTETWDNLSTDPDAAAYVETVINGSSALITVTDNLLLGNPPELSDPDTPPGDSLILGADDLIGVSDASYIGEIDPNGVATGMQSFANPETIDLNLLTVPGVSSAAVINAGIELCLERGDAMMIVDPPFGLSSQNVIKWHNGQAPYDDHQAFNSSYAALYWPWMQIFDPVNNVKVWTPPSGNVARAYAFTDRTTETWFAPAGTQRGHLVSPLKLEHSATHGERDFLYGNGNAVNPIISIPKEGITIWGQRTLQRAPTSLDRVNVRRMLLYLEKVIATATRFLVFEPNDSILWGQFKDLVTPFLNSVKQRRGLYDFKVICDKTTNTPDVIDRNEMHGSILLKPTKTAEFIIITFALTSTGAEFSTIQSF